MVDTRQVEDHWIELVHGTQFYFEAPTDSMIQLDEVAHSLAHLCRYNGHTRRFYSVAEHCVVLADYVEAHGGSARECLTALHHDSTESITGDMARPIKMRMPQFKELEVQLEEVFAHKFHTLFPIPAWLKTLDSRIIKDERRAIMNASRNDWGADELKPLGVSFMGVRGRVPYLMRQVFLARHKRWYDLMLSQGGGESW